MLLPPTEKQTLELLLSQERQRIQEALNAGMDLGDLIEDSVATGFQDVEPMTLEEWGNRLNNLELELLGVISD